MPKPIRSRLPVRSSLCAALALLASPAFAQSLSLLDARVVEGNSGGAQLLFEARLSAPASGNVTFDFATSDGSAVAASDYSGFASNGLKIPAGQTSLKIAVPVISDTATEANEYLNATLANVVGATLAKATAKGLIVNDEHMMLATTPADPAQSGSTGYATEETSISADGRFVAFTAVAQDLVGEGRPYYNVKNVYVRDNRTGTTTLASVAASGADANGDSTFARLSADGRYLVFQSMASNLVANDTNGGTDVFRRDLQTGVTALVSVNHDGTGSAWGYSSKGSPSADGRYIAFQSTASDLVAVDTNGTPDAFVRDMQSGTTALASVGPDGIDSHPGGAWAPSLSADGRFVAFDRGSDIWRRDMVTGEFTQVTVNVFGRTPNSTSYNAGISADGRYVVFSSWATDFGTPVSPMMPQVYRRDVQLGTTELVTYTWNNDGALDSPAHRPAMSADGRYVAYQTYDTASPDDNDTDTDVFVRDLLTDWTVKASKGWNGGGANGASEFASLSADGHFVAFVSTGTALLPGDTNGQPDVFRAEQVNPNLQPLYVTDATYAEGNDGIRQVTYTVSLPSPAMYPVSFDLATGDGSAVAGSDYVAQAWTGLTIPVGQVSASVTLELIADAIPEGYEGFNLYVTNVSGARAEDHQALVLIANDDAPPMPTLGIGDVAIAEGNSGTTLATFTVTLSEAAPVSVFFDVATANGTAIAGSDYVATSPTRLSIPDGSTSRTFTVAINGDGTYEANETFLVDVANVTGAVVADGQAIATITNDDAIPALSIADVAIYEGDSGTQTAAFAVTLSGRSAFPVTFDIATADGTATAGSDYVGKSTAGLTIPAGSSSVSFNVAVNGDTVVEPNENFQVNLANVAGAVVADGQAVGTIGNDDVPPVPPALSIADIAIVEGDSGTRLATFTVQLSKPAATPVTYDIWTGNGTAMATSDYIARTLVGQVIPAGASSASFTVSVNGDVAIEGDETFGVSVGNLVGATYADDGTGLCTIINDDALPALSIADVSIAEGNNSSKLATFTVSLSKAWTAPVSFNLATANGTAVAPGDYTAKTATAQVIAAGALSKTFTVSIKGDKTVEPSETFFVNVSNVSGATVADGQAVGTIVNDDGATVRVARVTTGGLYDDVDDNRGEPVLAPREYALLLRDAAQQVCARGGGATIVGVEGVESLSVLADLADSANLVCARQPQYRAALKADGLGFLVDGAQVLDVATLGTTARATAMDVLAEGHARPLTVLLAATPSKDARERATQLGELNRQVRARLSADPRARVVVLGATGLHGLVDLTARSLPAGVESAERTWVSPAMLQEIAGVRLEMPTAPKAKPAEQVLHVQP
jgi:hypothetical protein